MGVRGLTTFIANNADQYLVPFELHDCKLVVDGDSLSSNLYASTSKHSSAYGGNYDQFYRTVCTFFRMLRQCNVEPFVLLDGGYQPKKMSTVRNRLRSKIGAIKHLNPFDTKPIFPLLMRHVFIEALCDCDVRFMQCLFEADDEVAALARRLKCPVLSYDSDYYIHNVEYIPTVTLDFRVFRRNIPSISGRKSQRSQKVMEMSSGGDLREFKANKLPEDETNKSNGFYFFMLCSIYRMEHFTRVRQIRDELVPLLAVLLGNDYINRSLFRKFYENVSLKNTGKKNTLQVKRIIALLRWFRNETLESALAKIIGHIEKDKKTWLKQTIETTMNGYLQQSNAAFEYFGLRPDESNIQENFELNLDEIEAKAADAEKENNVEDGDADDVDDDEIDEESAEDDDKENGIKSPEIIAGSFEDFQPPIWLKPMISSGSLPRQVVDLMTMKLFINAPQVENFLLPDGHLIAIHILRLIFSIVNAPERPDLRYMTRVERRTDIQYLKFACFDEDILFDGKRQTNFETFQFAFREIERSIELFKHIASDDVPEDLRLFYLAILYWSKYSSHMNVVYVSCLIIGYIVVGITDRRLQSQRITASHVEQIKTRAAKQKNTQNETPKSISECIDSIESDECILTRWNLKEMFEVNPKMRTKHTEFSQDIMHGFAEFQSIAFQLNALNVICGSPFSSIRMSQFFNGCFLYNLYVTLKERPNVRYHIERFLFADAPSLFALFEKILAVIEPFVTCLKQEMIAKRKNRNLRKKKARELRKAQQVKSDINEAKSTTEQNQSANSDGSDFEDANNTYACLLSRH